MSHPHSKLDSLPQAEQLRYLISLVEYHKQMDQFIKINKDFPIPPAYLAYDAYSAPDWEFYKKSGIVTAEFIVDIGRRYISNKHITIFEWGCGPGRVIRHLPDLLSDESKVYGSDYNSATIAWCKQHIPKITFVQNWLEPPLEFSVQKFDYVYSISVFTHLSEAMHFAWMNELIRVTKSEGIILITTHGDSAAAKRLLPDELNKYNSGELVIRGKCPEGKRTFVAYHSPAFVKSKLLADLEILSYIPEGLPYSLQDVWVAKVP